MVALPHNRVEPRDLNTLNPEAKLKGPVIDGCYIPGVGSRWETDEDGTKFTVICIANIGGSKRFPVTIIGESRRGKIIARLAEEWYHFMTEVPPYSDPYPGYIGDMNLYKEIAPPAKDC
jgi:hypothetical protein